MKILKEQTQNICGNPSTIVEAQKLGYTDLTLNPPTDFTWDTYCFKIIAGKSFYKKKSGGNNPPPNPVNVNLDDYVGVYKGNIGKVHIEKKGNSLQVNVKISIIDKTWDLVQAGTDNFKFEGNKGTIKFNRSGNSVSSLDYEYPGIRSFTANKEGGYNPNETKTVWSCIDNSHEKHGVDNEYRLKPVNNTQKKMTQPSGNIFYYNIDYKFKIVFNDDKKSELDGTWKCNGNSDFTILMDTGETYTSTTGKWTIPEQNKKSFFGKKLIKENIQNENYSFKSLIKKHIVDAKEKKDSSIIENNLINSRLKFVLGNDDFNKLSEDKKIKVSFGLFEEIATLSNQGFINEDNLLNTFKGLFGNDVHSLPETFYKPWIDTVLKTLNMSDSYLKKYLISQLTKNPSEVWSSFEDCEKMTYMVAKALSETLIFHLRMDKDFSSLPEIRNSLEETMREEVFINKIEEKISGMICSSFEKYASKASDVLDRLKQ
jgi:hypothetical protein